MSRHVEIEEGRLASILLNHLYPWGDIPSLLTRTVLTGNIELGSITLHIREHEDKSMNLADEFTRTLSDAGNRLGVELNENLDEVREYAAEQMLALSAAVDEPGYDEVLKAAGINVALKAASAAVESADSLDREIVGLVTGALAIGARALVA